ncbi:hypothetical protein VSS26_15025 [Klebsiella pneumoniae]|uniref:hypothetical protein n=1 Tax=Klebsiella pneumoniae TaxID=573 RepID=UPI002DBF55A4|nr:hypothetical protein [Klebsiella pneumoniae]MEC4329838.1 hypothetical protein [Klebsiella pneumoniae]
MINNQLTDERVTSVIERLEHYASNLKWTNVRGAQDLLTAADGLRELQERRKPLQDKDLQGVIDALEHPAGINTAGKQVVRHALVEIQERRKADREPVAEVVSIYGDPEAFGEREIRPLVGIQQMPYGTKLYRHAQPAPEKYNIGDATMRHIFTPTGMTNVSDMQAVFDRVEAVLVGVEQPAPVVPEEMTAGIAVKHWQGGRGSIESFVAGYNFCRAAMLAAAPQSPGSEPATVPGKWIPVSEQKPDCWCITCRPVTLNDMRFVVCPDCGNKRCPRANDHRNACSGSNEPGQEGSGYPDTPREVK